MSYSNGGNISSSIGFTFSKHWWDHIRLRPMIFLVPSRFTSDCTNQIWKVANISTLLWRELYSLMNIQQVPLLKETSRVVTILLQLLSEVVV